MNVKKAHSKEFKFKVAIEAIKGDLTLAELSSKYGVASSLVSKWKSQLLSSGKDVFAKQTPENNPKKEIEQLHATIGRLKVENDFLAQVLAH